MRFVVRCFAAWWVTEFVRGATAEWRAISAARRCKTDVANLWEREVPDTRPTVVVSPASAQLETANR